MGSTDRATIPPGAWIAPFRWRLRRNMGASPCQAQVFWICSNLSNALSQLASVHCITSSVQQKNTSLGCKPQSRTQILLYIRRRMFIGLAGHLLISAYREAYLSFVFLIITRSALHGCFIWQMIFLLLFLDIMDLNFPCFTWRDLEEIPLTVVEHTVVHIGSKGKEENTCMLTIVLFFFWMFRSIASQKGVELYTKSIQYYEVLNLYWVQHMFLFNKKR